MSAFYTTFSPLISKFFACLYKGRHCKICSHSLRLSNYNSSIMRKIVYFKLLQIVLSLAFVWQLISLHQFCGTFVCPKAFLHDISVGHCKRFTLIGKDAKTGEFGAVFDERKWHNQLFISSTNGLPIEEQQQQFMDELAAKLPCPGRHCISISLSPFFWTEKDRNLLDNVVDSFSGQLFLAMCSLLALGIGFIRMLRSAAEYEFYDYCSALYSVFCWCVSAWLSSYLLLYWTPYWSCMNFRADATNVPLVTLVFSIVMVCSFVFEMFFNNSLLKKRPVNASVAAADHKLRNDVATECANVAIHRQQQQKNGSAIIMQT